MVDPLVSVVIPTFNSAEFIRETLVSVLDQDYRPLEVVLVDDGSSDDTVAIARECGAEVRVVRQENSGAAVARNRGVEEAKGDLVCFLDSDDLWLPGKISAQVRYLQEHPETGAVYHDWIVWHGETDAKRTAILNAERRTSTPRIDPPVSGWIYTKLLMDSVIQTSTIMVRREILREVGPFDVQFRSGQDYDLWLRLSRHCRIDKLDFPFSLYRILATSLSHSRKYRIAEETIFRSAVQRWGLAGPDGQALPRADLKRRICQFASSRGYAAWRNGDYGICWRQYGRVLRLVPWHAKAWGYVFASLAADGLRSVRRAP